MKRCLTPVAFLSAVSLGTAVSACEFTTWQTYKGTELLRSVDENTYFWVTSRKHVDADGAPNAYHPDDTKGRSCPDTGKGLDCPANAGYDFGDWSDVLVSTREDADVPYVQPDGPFSGFFVSQTALVDGNFGIRSTSRYVDASTVPYVVFPGNFYKLKGTGRPGDFGVAMHLATGKRTPFVVGDVGAPDHLLGEASVAFFQALGADNPNPRRSAGLSGDILYVMFPRSKYWTGNSWPMSIDKMEAITSTYFNSLIGDDFLTECASYIVR